MDSIGPRAAADLYRCFALDTLAGARAQQSHAEVIVAAAEPDDLASVGDMLRDADLDAGLVVQSGRDLGRRIANVVEDALQQGHPRVVVTGSDAPSLPASRVRAALDLSGERDLVLGPCLDGGYYLVGLRSPIPEIFEGIPWSSDSVLVDSVRRARARGHSVALLDPWYDIDTASDLRFLRAHLTAISMSGDPVPCPRTWKYLCDTGLPEQES
jgi:rSAM/selenodomain-associated transferase 1